MNKTKEYRYKPLVNIVFYDDSRGDYAINFNGKLRFVPIEDFERDYEEVKDE